MKNILISFFALPLWVQIWLALVLIPMNFSCLLLLDTNVGYAVAIAGIGVLIFNGFLCWMNQGLSKVLAIPHLIFWGPLQVYLGLILFSGEWDGTTNTMYYAWAVFVTNGISLVFDAFDTKEWIKGKREIPGHPDFEPWL